ncbi:hypothetical protein [Falsiroseomonas sp. HW251]|uniref:hypothetical protein n=1 Tax=Falsiroseomonas sp. HW251 TaxID=3390998 RepID=UPI003D32388C
MAEQPRPKPGSPLIAVERAKPRPRELPHAPEHEPAPWTLSQIAGAAILVICGIAVVGFFALGLPLAAIGGPSVLIVPLLGIALFMRRGMGGGRR